MDPCEIGTNIEGGGVIFPYLSADIYAIPSYAISNWTSTCQLVVA